MSIVRCWEVGWKHYFAPAITLIFTFTISDNFSPSTYNHLKFIISSSNTNYQAYSTLKIVASPQIQQTFCNHSRFTAAVKLQMKQHYQPSKFWLNKKAGCILLNGFGSSCFFLSVFDFIIISPITHVCYKSDA